MVTTVRAYLGATQYEGPLLFTLLAVTASTMAISVITTGVSASGSNQDPNSVRRTATAYFVFVNAAGSITTLAGHVAEVLETGWDSHSIGTKDGLSLMLDLAQISHDAYFWTYIVANSALLCISLILVFYGASLIVGKREATQSELNTTGFISLCLLVTGLMIGFPWAPVDADTRTAMASYGAGLRLITALIIFAAIAIYCFFSLLSLYSFAKIFSLSSLRIGRKINLQNIGKLARRIIIEFLYGSVWAAAIAALCATVWFLTLVWIITWQVLPEEATKRIATGFAAGASIGSEFVLWMLLSCLGIVALRVFAKPVVYGFVEFLIWFLQGFFGLLQMSVAATIFTISVLVEAVLLIGRSITFLFNRSNRQPKHRASKSTTISKWFFDRWSRFAPTVSFPEVQWKAVARFIMGIASLSVVIGLCFWLYAWKAGTRDTVPVVEMPPTEDAEEASVDEDTAVVPLPGFEFARAMNVTLCDPIPGAFNWALGREDALEVSLHDCILPSSVADAADGVLVVVSVASKSGNQEREEQRALNRARALASWAKINSPDKVRIYVLNLGMATNDTAFTSGWFTFGRVRGDRPVPALFIAPYPEGTEIPLSAVVSELSDSLKFARVADNFSQCELLSISENSSIGSALVPMEGFNCTDTESMRPR